MSPTRRSFVKAAVATIAAASFTWPDASAARPIPDDTMLFLISLDPTIDTEVNRLCKICSNGDLEFELRQHYFDSKTNQKKYEVISTTLVVHHDERLTIHELFNRMAAAGR